MQASDGSLGSDAVGQRTTSMGKDEIQLQKAEHLKEIFLVAEQVDDEEKAEAAERHKSYAVRLKNWWKNMSNAEFENCIDLCVGLMICINAVLIGIHMDNPEPHNVWLGVDVAFSCIFIMELTIKIKLKGFNGQFCSEGGMANCFDAFLISLDLTQLLLELLFPQVAESFEGAPSASLFRIVRLARLGRLVRAMKAEVFRSLVEMLHGIVAGITTLGWSCVLFFFFLYISALILRESLGRTEQEFVYEMYNSVPRAMYTTFRCSFGDCTSHDGTPIYEHVIPTFGVAYVIVYCFLTFVTTVVIFNVISAMFVESTMAAAASLSTERKRARMKNEKLLFSKITFLIKRFLDFSPDHEAPAKLSEEFENILHLEVSCSVIDEAVHDPAVAEALQALDIATEDHERLSDIFDPDNGGTVELGDIADGLCQLRGDPRRIDIVCVDLMLRSMQPILTEILEAVQQAPYKKCLSYVQ